MAEFAAIAYQEPSIRTMLVLASLLLVATCVNEVLDNLLCCGLLGQVIVGIAWGTPGAKWVEPTLERAITDLGYLGLILLVYEGSRLPYIGT